MSNHAHRRRSSPLVRTIRCWKCRTKDGDANTPMRVCCPRHNRIICGDCWEGEYGEWHQALILPGHSIQSAKQDGTMLVLSCKCGQTFEGPAALADDTEAAAFRHLTGADDLWRPDSQLSTPVPAGWPKFN